MQLQLQRDEVRELWNQILDVLLEGISSKSITVVELGHVIEEIKLLLYISKGQGSVWASVIDVALLLFEKDESIQDLKQKLPYNESTIYRALNRLEAGGVIRSSPGETTARIWTLNRDKCPALYRASRSA